MFYYCIEYSPGVLSWKFAGVFRWKIDSPSNTIFKSECFQIRKLPLNVCSLLEILPLHLFFVVWFCFSALSPPLRRPCWRSWKARWSVATRSRSWCRRRGRNWCCLLTAMSATTTTPSNPPPLRTAHGHGLHLTSPHNVNVYKPQTLSFFIVSIVNYTNLYF